MRYLTTAEVAERYRTAESTVRYWRHLQKGPRGIKVGKRVLYPEAELLRYERALIDDGDNWDLVAARPPVDPVAGERCLVGCEPLSVGA